MMDDYGAGADEVSALAGIHYFQCRPYTSGDVGVFSPPEGNGYFVEKLAKTLPTESLLTGHLVWRIEPLDDGFMVDVLDVRDNQRKRFQVDKVVYAGHKQGLRYILPQASQPFAHVTYAPWIVMNFLLESRRFDQVWWQNEVIDEDPRFLGFVNSMAQAREAQGMEVLTAYYCLPQSERQLMLDLDQKGWTEWAARALNLVNIAMDGKIADKVRRVFVKLHGHGMPIPAPGYLFRDANENRPFANLVYAGVDNGRLPLIYEAFDSGLEAARLLNQQKDG